MFCMLKVYTFNFKTQFNEVGSEGIENNTQHTVYNTQDFTGSVG